MPRNASPRRLVQGTLVAIFAALLLLPLFQQVARLPADRGLAGVRTSTAEFPAWTARAWQRGEFAAAADAWIRERVGMRGWLVALDRQIRYSLFGQLAAAPLHRRAVVVGEGRVLHENIYLAEALRRPVVAPAKMEEFAARLARVQGLLRGQGAAFLVVLAPNKALLYPDTLPRWARGRVADEHADFPAFLAALRRHGVAHLDTMDLFRRLRPAFPDLVAPHGSHWSFHGAWVALQHAIPVINRQRVLPEIPVPETEELILQDPLSTDDELRTQLNIFFGRHLAPVPAAYPVAAPPPPGSERKIDALVVGDSYGIGLTDALARSRLCDRILYLFYMNSAYETSPGFYDSRAQRVSTGGAALGLFRNSSDRGRQFLSGRNLVVLVLTSFNVDKDGWGFDRMVERLYGNLDDGPSPLDAAEVNLED